MKKNNNKFKILDKRGEEQEIVTPTDPLIDLTPVVIIPDAPDYSALPFAMCGDRILIQNFPRVKQYGHIITPQNLEIYIDKGRIVACGPDVKKLKVGDIVYKIANMGQTLTTDDGVEYTFHPENAAISIDTNLTPDFDKTRWEKKDAA